MFESFLLLCGSSVSIVRLLKLRRWDVADRLEQTTVVEPVDPFQRGELDLLGALPGPFVADDLGLVEADDALGEGVDAPIAVKQPRTLAGGLGGTVAFGPRLRGQESA